MWKWWSFFSIKIVVAWFAVHSVYSWQPIYASTSTCRELFTLGSSRSAVNIHSLLQFFKYRESIQHPIMGGNPFVRLVASGKDRAFAKIELNSDYTIQEVKFFDKESLTESHSDPATQIARFLLNPGSYRRIGKELMKYQTETLARKNLGSHSALVKVEMLGQPLEPLATKIGYPFHPVTNTDNESYLQLKTPGSSKAFALIQINTQNEIIGFKPLTKLSDLSNLPDCPAVRLAREVSNSIGERDVLSSGQLVAQQTRLEAFNKLPSFDSPERLPEQVKNFIAVKQGKGLVASSALGTQGLYTCIGIAVVNIDTKLGFLIHADAKTDVISLMSQLNAQLGDGHRVAAIAGGLLDDNLLYQIISTADSLGIEIKLRKSNQFIEDLYLDPNKIEFY